MRILRMPRRRATLPAVAALTISVALTGCSSGPDEDLVPVSPFETVAMPVDTAPTAVPGQHLAMGQIVALPQLDPTSTPDDIIETTVVGVAQGDVAFWETFDNASEFAGETPYFAVIQYRWVTGDVSAYTTPLLRPVLEDGTEGGIIQKEVLGALVSNTACPFDVGRFDLEDDRGPEEYIACVLYSAPTGTNLVGLNWRNLSPLAMSEPDPAVNPFYTSPVVWDVTPVTWSSPIID